MFGLVKLGILLVLNPWSPNSHTLLVQVQVGVLRHEGFLEIRSALFQANEADAVTVDAGLVHEAGLAPKNLKPVVAEFYGSQESKFSLDPYEGLLDLIAY